MGESHDQEQFLHVLDRDEADRRFRAAIDLAPRGIEQVALEAALGRVLAADAVSPVDVPSFDRSNVDGFAVVAADTVGASEEHPRPLALAGEVIHTGVVPAAAVQPGQAVSIATGGMMPRGADAVVMIEYADTAPAGGPDRLRQGFGESAVASAKAEGPPLLVNELRIYRSVTPGSGVSFAGTDITAGETVVRAGQILGSRDTGVLAAIGVASVDVWRKPVVAILSTGDEIIPPGAPMEPARVYDSNAQVLADAVRELGGEPRRMGIVPDELDALQRALTQALESSDIVLLSGGTSKGAGDVSYRAVAALTDPGIVAHGVALKPGKPICLAATGGKPVVVLPGFPTSAIFTFHEFVAPVLAAMGGRRLDERATVQAKLAVRVNSEIGRTEYLLVGLVESGLGSRPSALVAYPMGQGSGSVTTFSRADGFTTIGRHEEIVPAGATVTVQLLDPQLQIADLVVIGSHCIGLDYLLSQLQRAGVRAKFLAVGSLAGLDAVKHGECDLAGVHLLDVQTGEYNRAFLTDELDLIPGYGRLQGIVFRKGDERIENINDLAGYRFFSDTSLVMVNRNQGSGTRALIDRLLGGAKPAGYAVQPRTHNAVAAAVAQGRADWGMTLDTVARRAGLGFIPVQHEQYDFVTPRARAERPGVIAFRKLLASPETREALARLGMRV
jgi:putative molybdopterin biosynthesis protein